MKPDNNVYHRVFSFLHWAVVFLVGFLYATGYYRLRLTTQSEPLNWHLLVWHMNTGALIVCFTLLILVVKLIARIPTEKAPNPLVRLTTHIVHWGLYVMLLAIPLAAYMGLGFDFPLAGQINIPGLMRFAWVHQWVSKYFQMPLITFMEPFAQFHRDTGADIILPALLVLHVGAALYHHFVLKDMVLIRVLPSSHWKLPNTIHKK